MASHHQFTHNDTQSSSLCDSRSRLRWGVSVAGLACSAFVCWLAFVKPAHAVEPSELKPTIYYTEPVIIQHVVAGQSPDSDEEESPRPSKNTSRYREKPYSAQSSTGYSRLRPVRRPEQARPTRNTDEPAIEGSDEPATPAFEPRQPQEGRQFDRTGLDRSAVDRSGADRPDPERQDYGRDEENQASDEQHTNSTQRPQTFRGQRSQSNRSYSQQESNSETAGLVPDDGGPVAELLLHYSVSSEPELGVIYRDLFQQLSPAIQLQVCCPNEQSAEAFTSRWGAAAADRGRSVHVINVNRPITVWARDRRICRQTPDGQAAACFVPVAHSTYDPEKQNDLVLTSLLWSTGLVPSVALTSLHLEGGNTVSNRRHVFVGANAYEDNEHRFDSEETLFGELSRLFGRPTVAIQGKDGGVPWIHTDMYLTPIDTKTILVASPALGCDLLPNRKTIVGINRGKPAAVEFDQVHPDSGRQQRFDDVAKQLEDLGYQVIRMPALMNVQKDWMVTYNNVIMDYQDGQRVVYMPVYNIPELDQAATQTYRALGFDVKPIDVSAIFQLGGAIRCLANVTRRLPFESRSRSRETETSGRLQVYSVDPAANRAREIRPRREKRPATTPFRERAEPAAQGYSALGSTGFSRPNREAPEQDAPVVRERPTFERPDATLRQPQGQPQEPGY